VSSDSVFFLVNAHVNESVCQTNTTQSFCCNVYTTFWHIFNQLQSNNNSNRKKKCTMRIIFL
jgi:hypothetical protein